ncbi:4-galactosyl-N-acetylglucosaminide 3-alpha-L-fucosyltransferase FUT6-like [Styela clava]
MVLTLAKSLRIGAFAAVFVFTLYGFIHGKFSSEKRWYLIDNQKNVQNQQNNRKFEQHKIVLFWHTELPDKSVREDHMESIKKYIAEAHTLYSPIDECGNCSFTMDMSKITDNNTAAVIFLYKFVEPGKMPIKRRNDQLYIYWTKESPSTLKYYHNETFDFEESIKFNSTMGYRRNSDIYTPFLTSVYRTLQIKDLSDNNVTWIPMTKNKWAAAVISNCGATPAAVYRHKLVTKISILSEGRLKTFGKCFRKQISRKMNSIPNLLKSYKFYLAFENSYHCRDYITEKLFQNAFHGNTVPVVWGATKADYTSLAPPGSFIFAEDFNSVEELVTYLNYLDRNDTAYLEYFRWRTMRVENFSIVKQTKDLCQLCKIIQGKAKYNISDPNHVSKFLSGRNSLRSQTLQKKVTSLKEWFFEEENKECLNFRGKSYF